MKKMDASLVRNRLYRGILLLAAAVAMVLFLPVMAGKSFAALETYTVKVDSGYLALRTAKAYDASNEIGELYTGDTVQVSDKSDSTYWYVYSPKYNQYGYVNKNYLAGAVSTATVSSGFTYTVKVDSGYLALRTAKAYDASNEIGELYTGDTVQVLDASDSAYWYVYSAKLGKYGYVNKDYLQGGSIGGSVLPSGSLYLVKVDSGYLALRTAKAYDASNEIGELYTGDMVQVLDSSDTGYWYVYSPKYDKYGFVNKDYLVGGSVSNLSLSTGSLYSVKVDSGYLALRSAKAYDAANEIGELYTGDMVQVVDSSDTGYWYVYSPKHDRYGYVNKDYLTGGVVGGGTSSQASASGTTYTVRVNSGYLALRNAKAYDAANEIGELYTGDTVQVLDTADATYWYVYSPKYDKYGYVNKDYLY